MTEETQEVQSVDETVEGNEVASDAPALGLVDIKNAIAVIDYAAEQGSFKGWGTIQQVMNVRQKLAAFVEASTPQEVKDAEAAEAAVEETAEEAAEG